jgi:uncharacterized protein
LVAAVIRRFILWVFFFVLGVVALLMSIIGILPLVPGIPFLIIASYCFARSARSLQNLLHRLPIAGEHLRKWDNEGKIVWYVKALSILYIWLTVAVTEYYLSETVGQIHILAEWGLRIIIVLIAIFLTRYIFSRPES